MLLQQCSVSFAWRLDREMRRLILHETGGRVFFRIFTCYLFLNLFSTCVSDNLKYVCSRRLYGCKKYMKIQGPRFQRNCIIARNQKSDLHGMSLQLLPKIKCMLITRSICIQWKVTTPDHCRFAKGSYFFRPLSSVYLFESNQRFQAIEFVDQHVLEKLLI